MKKLAVAFMAIICLTICACGTTPQQEEVSDNTTKAAVEKIDSPEWVAKLTDIGDAHQVFVVAGVGKTTAYVSMHERGEDGKWYEIITTPGFIGKNGLGKTKEGDGKTPVGKFNFNYAFGIAPDPGCAIPYQQVNEDYYWSGDETYHYNEMVKLSEYPKLNTEDSEHIIEYGVHYQLCLNISYNDTGEAGKGSAIFLHCLGPQKPYTGGCIAIPQDKMEKVMKAVTPDCVVIIDDIRNISPETCKDWDI